MRWLLRLFDRARPHFDRDKKLRAFKLVFEDTEDLFFTTAARTENGPHVRDPLDVKRFMSMVIIALAPCVLAAFYFFGLRVLAMILVSYAVGGAVEVAFAIVRKREINEGFLVTGLVFPLTLPPALPLWMVGVGVAFGVLVGKELFGGTGRNLFNPALVGRCFLVLGYPALGRGSPAWGGWGRLAQYVDASDLDAITSATPLVSARLWVTTGVPLPPLSDLFFGRVSGCVGETSALAIIVGGVFLILTRVANWRTVAGCLGAFAGLSAVLHWAEPGRFAPAAWHLGAGGFLLGAFFMATDPVTSPTTNAGKWAYGALIGLATVLIRNFTGHLEGTMFAILLGNICAPVLDEIVIRRRFRRLAHCFAPTELRSPLSSVASAKEDALEE